MMILIENPKLSHLFCFLFFFKNRMHLLRNVILAFDFFLGEIHTNANTCILADISLELNWNSYFFFTNMRTVVS